MVYPNTIKQAGAQSVTIDVPAVFAGDPPVAVAFGTVGVLDWAQLPAGKLKNLLNKSYTVGGFGSFFDAAAEAGFTSQAMTKTVIGPAGAHTDTVSWTLDGEGYPTATVVTVDPFAEYQIRIQTAYSASE